MQSLVIQGQEFRFHSLSIFSKLLSEFKQGVTHLSLLKRDHPQELEASKDEQLGEYYSNPDNEVEGLILGSEIG